MTKYASECTRGHILNFEHIRVDYLNFITDKYPNFQFLSNELKFIWLLISEDRLIMNLCHQ